jgi:hypothetical protein
VNVLPEDFDFLDDVSSDPEVARERQLNKLVDALLKKKPSWSRRRARRWIEREEARSRARDDHPAV